jgi:hypothetical protein
MRNGIVTALVVITIVGACTVGKSGKELMVATGPAGASIRVAVPQGAVTGELVTLREHGLIVRSGTQLRFLPYGIITRLTVSELGPDYAVSAQGGMTAQKKAKLRLVSRFPHGMTPQIEREFLAKLGQSAIDTVR